jgi:hypothetical protein
MMLVPKRWYCWDFAVVSQDRTVADLDLSSWREKGVVSIDGREYTVGRERMMSGDFFIRRSDQMLARATKPSAFANTFIVRFNDRSYTLKKKSVWSRAFVLHEGDREIGSVAPKSLWTRHAAVNLPPDWPLPIRAFVIWLAIVIWKRDADAGAGA